MFPAFSHLNISIICPAFRFLAVKKHPILYFALVPEHGSPEPLAFDKDLPVLFDVDNELLIVGMHEGKELVHAIAAVKDIGGQPWGAREASPEAMESGVIHEDRAFASGRMDVGKERLRTAVSACSQRRSP